MLRKLLKVGPRGIWLALAKRTGRFARLRKRGRVVIGHASYGAPNVRIYQGDRTTKLIVGKYSSLASTATFLLGGNHPTNRITTYPLRLRFGLSESNTDGYPSSKGDIIVGSDVWIGHEALILSGVTIGDGAVVAARAVVTKDVPPYAIVAGNPARAIRERVPAHIARKLLELKWWDWPQSEVLKRVAELSAPFETSTLLAGFTLDDANDH